MKPKCGRCLDNVAGVTGICEACAYRETMGNAATERQVAAAAAEREATKKRRSRKAPQAAR